MRTKTIAKVVALGSSMALALALALTLLPGAFADQSEDPTTPTNNDPVYVDPIVKVLGEPYLYTGEQICPANLLVIAELDDESIVTLQPHQDYNYTCGENIEIGSDSGTIDLVSLPSSAYEFDDLTVEFGIWAGLQNINYENTTITKTYGDGDFINPLTKTTVYGDIFYESSDEDVAFVDPYTGEVTIMMPGETVITATAEDFGDYAPATATYTLIVDKKEVYITSAEADDKEYDGTTIADIIDITLNDDGLTELADFDIIADFEDSNVGTNKNVNVTITLTNEAFKYYTVAEQTYTTTATIVPYDISTAYADLLEDNLVYSGITNHPTVVAYAFLDRQSDAYYLDPTSDFTISYPEDSVSAGHKTLLITGQNNFSDTLEVDYTVNQYSLAASNISLEYTTAYYDGSAKEPAVTVKIGNFIVNPDEYTIVYDNNIAIGTATVTVAAKDNVNIKGNATKSFDITAKQILNIHGIESQAVTYTGSPVVLNGTLIVDANSDGITANDLATTWYDQYGNIIEHPIAAGSYTVVYSYSNDHYQGGLSVDFTIEKAISPTPKEMTANLSTEVNNYLDEIAGERTPGFFWVDESTLVSKGAHNYAATYTYNNDSRNYTTLTLSVPVYGITRVNIDLMVDAGEGYAEAPSDALEHDTVVVTLEPDSGYELKSIIVNAADFTNAVENNTLSIYVGTKDLHITVSFRRVYNVIEGDGENFIVNDSGELISFRINADHTLFENGGKVYVDGELVNEGYYTHKTGSTIITFTKQFLDLLTSGNHQMTVVFSDGGVAHTNFTVEKGETIKVPDTGFFTGEGAGARIIGLTAIVLSITGVLTVIIKRHPWGHKVDFD